MAKIWLLCLSLVIAATQPVRAVEEASTATASGVQPSGVGAKLKITLAGVDEAALIDNIHAFLELDELTKTPIKNPNYVRYLIDAGAEQIQQALQPFGYYLSTVKTTLKETKNQWDVHYQVMLGKPVIISQVLVRVTGEGETDPDFQALIADYPLQVGETLLQQKYTDFKDEMLALATTNGYFDGQFTQAQIVLSDDLTQAEIQVIYDAGQRYTFGPSSFEQNVLDEDVFQRFVTYASGDVYHSQAVSDTQRDIYNAGYIKAIDVTADPDKASKTVPIAFVLHPKKNKRHRFALGYGTDTGARAKYDFDWRWVNRRGHRFTSKAFVSQKLLEAGAEYHVPAQKPATDYYQFFANYRQDKGGDKVSNLWNIGAAYRDQKGKLTRELGIKWQQEDFTVGNDSGNIGLLTPYAKLTYRRVDDPLNVKQGFMLSGTVTGAHTGLLSDVSFVQATASSKYIRRFHEQHKLTLAGALGRTYVNDFHQLPSAYRFFTGGDRTVRGYRFEKIGDTDSSGAVIGGNKMYRMSAEYEYFFKENMAAATFIDAGDAFSADAARLKVGAGLGFHYYSPIGPIKIDVAHGFHQPGDDFRLHLSIGPEL